MKGITTELIAEVRNRANLLEIIAEQVVLKRAGKDYKGLCPFHPEKTPSFFANPEKGIFKCFGCGEGGDVFAFIQKTKRLEFVDAVKELAERVGISLLETAADKGEYDKRSTLLMLYQQAAEYYAKLLNHPGQGSVAQDYLKHRGISADVAHRFKLGYAPAVWDGLLRYLTQANKVTGETLVEAGLARKKADTTHFYDLFRNRLIVPIQDEQGRVIAFGGRTLEDDQVKYLNSPESLLYTKGEHLFALYQAKESIKEKDAVLVVEGYFDAICAHQHGFQNTVATLGTALTERQGKLLVRFTESRRVYLCFDSDLAGQKAAKRGMETLSQLAEGVGIEMRIVSLPYGKDPDECLRSGGETAGAQGFGQALEKAALLLDYQLEQAIIGVKTDTHTGRIEAAKLVVPFLASIKNAVARGEYVRQWASRLAVREEDLLMDVGNYRRVNRLGPEKTIPASASYKKNTKSGHFEAEIQLLASYLASPEDYEFLCSQLMNEHMLDPVHERIKEAIEGIGRFTAPKDFWQHLQDRLAHDLEANKRLSYLDSKVDEIKKPGLSTENIVKESRLRLLQERLNQATVKLWEQMKQKPGEEEEVLLQSKILQLKKIQNSLQTSSKTEEWENIKQRIDAVLVEAIS